MAESLDRMVTQVPEEEVFPTPTQVEGQPNKMPGCDGTPIAHAAKETYHSSTNEQVRIVTPAPKKEVVPTPTETPLKVVQVQRKSEKKMTLIPPKKKDNPKLSKQYKKKNEVIKDDPKQKKISNLFKPIMKTTSSTVDEIPSNNDIYIKDNNFEDDLTFEDNLGCPTDFKNFEKREDSKSQIPDQPERQVLGKFLEGSKSITKKNAPDLALTGLTGITLSSTISNQHLAGESWRPNDHQDQVETSEHSGCGSNSVSLT